MPVAPSVRRSVGKQVDVFKSKQKADDFEFFKSNTYASFYLDKTQHFATFERNQWFEPYHLVSGSTWFVMNTFLK